MMKDLFSDILAISKSVGKSRLSLVAALQFFLVQGVFHLRLNNFSLCLIHKAYILKVFGVKNSPISFVKEPICHRCRTRKLWLLLFGSFVSLNRSKSIKSRLPVTFRCLYIALILSRFTFCLNSRVDVASVVPGSMNDVSPTLLVSGML